MTSASMTRSRGGINWRLPTSSSVVWPLAILSALLVAQFSLIFSKSFNWDEFLHFSMVHQLREGTLARPFQSLLARLLSWSPEVFEGLYSQMIAARLFSWAAFLIGLGAIFGLARQFVSREDAVWTTLVYAAAGYVFVHAFAIRTDPIAMAALMGALYLFVSRQVGWSMALTVGLLIGLAGMLTLKSIFYAPCFIGVAWLRYSRAQDKRSTLFWICAIAPVSVTVFAATYLLHSAGLAPLPEIERDSASLRFSLQWLTQGLLYQPKYSLVAFVTAPILTYALVISPFAWRKNATPQNETVALACFWLPLLTILFYRNTFPYFFVFILAPAAVGSALAVAEVRKKIGPIILAAVICVVPLTKYISESKDTIYRQRALLEYIHKEYPDGTVYFDYCGIIADFPRVIDHLVSGIGIATYNQRGVPLVANAVRNGQLAFVVSDHYIISKALAGEMVTGGLLPDDVAALHGNFVRFWGDLWLAGEEVPSGSEPAAIEVPHGSAYTTDTSLTVDGVAYSRGDVIQLAAGRHTVDGHRPERAILWRGTRLPAPAPKVPASGLLTNF